MDEKGVYAIARSIWECEAFLNEKYTQREAWSWLIGAACWRQKRINIDGIWLTLERGEFSHALRFLATKFKWSKDRVARFMKHLVNEDMIRDTSRDGRKVYSINKYNEFQVVGLPDKDANKDSIRDKVETPTRQPCDKEETLKTLEKKKVSKERPSAPPKPLVVSMLPDWLPLEAWSAFLDMRRKKRAVTTDHAIGLILKDLDRWRQLGHDPTEILNTSIKSSWTDVYEPKAGKNGNRQQKPANSHSNFFAAAASIVNDLADDGPAGEGDGIGAAGPACRPLLSS